MDDARKYARAPIVEAVLEIRFSDPIGDRELERLRDRFKRDYPAVEVQHQVDVEIKSNAVSGKSIIRGYKMTAKNAVDLVIAQVDRLVTSRLAPYESWDQLISLAKQNFQAFEKIAGRRTISRIGARFINRIDIPVSELKGVDVVEYIKLSVAMPETLTREIGPYSIAVNFMVNGVKVLAQTGISEAALLEHVSIMLDIDANVDSGISMHKDAVWHITNQLRIAKNRVFEECITDKVRARLQ